jgi:uncharacterized membrane protein YczE
MSSAPASSLPSDSTGPAVGTWSSPALNLTRRYVQFLIGLFLYGIAIAAIVRAEIGVGPWDVLTQGFVNQTGLSFGLLTNLIGAVVLLLWIPIRQKPGIGTLLNVLLVGPSAQVGLWLIPAPESMVLRVPLFAAGLLLLAIATGLYIGARFGPGPRDGLMTGIHHRWGGKLWIIRTAIEVAVLAVGWVLGGNVGVGTLAFALLIGPLVGFILPRLVIPAARRTDAGVGMGADADAATDATPAPPSADVGTTQAASTVDADTNRPSPTVDADTNRPSPTVDADTTSASPTAAAVQASFGETRPISVPSA